MITEIYVKGRYDFGKGKCAVVIVNKAKVIGQFAWCVPDKWEYNGQAVHADQYNCEILAATYALNWCMLHGQGLVNIYANTTSAQKWYFRGDFPDNRSVQGKAYLDAVDAYQRTIDAREGEQVMDAVFADYIPKNYPNEFNMLVNRMAENL